MSLYVSPQGGFGNRLRTVCGALILADMLGKQARHLWIPYTPHPKDDPTVQQIKSTHWTDFFEELPDKMPEASFDRSTQIDTVFTEWFPENDWYKHQSIAQSTFQNYERVKYDTSTDVVNVASASENILLESTNFFKFLETEVWNSLKHAYYQQYFRPQPVYSYYLSKIPEYDACIWVRNHWYFQEFFPCTVLTDDLLDARVLEKCSKHDRVLVLSDHHETKMRLNKKVCAAYPLFIDDLDLNHKHFLVFLILATKCKKIYGTPFSSFAQEAAIYGNVEYEELYEDYKNF